MTTSVSLTDVNKGLLYGALGDAWGAAVEFYPYDKITRPVPLRCPMTVTDDTQMALEVRWWLLNNKDNYDNPNLMATELYNNFLRWLSYTDDSRGSGFTCTGSLYNMYNHAHDDVSIAELINKYALESSGCGAVMRVFPVMDTPQEYHYIFAAAQAIITHKTPQSVVATWVLIHMWHTLKDTGTYTINNSLDFLSTTDMSTIIPTDSPWMDFFNEATGGDFASWIQSWNTPDDNNLTITDALTKSRQWTMESRSDMQDTLGAGGWDSVSILGYITRGAELIFHDKHSAMSVMESLIATSGDSDSIGTILGHTVGWMETEIPLEYLSYRLEKEYYDDIINDANHHAIV